MRRIPWTYRDEHVYKPLGDQFFPRQAEVIRCVDNEVQFITLVGGVGGAKSWSVARAVLPEIVMPVTLRALNGWPENETINVWVVGPDFEKPRVEFKYIIDAIEGCPYLLAMSGGWKAQPSLPREGGWQVETNLGVVIESRTWAMTSGSDPIHAKPVHIMLVVEAGLLDLWTYENRLVPRIGRTNGLMLLSGTLEEDGILIRNLYKKGLSATGRHRSFAIASWENIFKFPGGRNDPAIRMMEEELSPDTFMERCASVPKKPTGLVHPYFDYARHVGDYPFDGSLPVQLWVDPGANGYYVAAAQVKGDGKLRSAYVIDEYFESTNGTTEKAIAWLLSQPWAESVQAGAIDVRMLEQREMWRHGTIWHGAANQTRLRGVMLRGQNVPVLAGIERVNTLLHSIVLGEERDRYKDILVEAGATRGLTRLFVDRRCRELIWEMSQGYKFPKTRDDQLKQKPEDRHNHACKALAYGLVDVFGFVEAKRGKAVYTGEPLAHLRPGYQPVIEPTIKVGYG